MRPFIQEIATPHTPESLVAQLQGEPGLVLLRSALFDSPQARYSLVAARPFLTFRSFGSRCEITHLSSIASLSATASAAAEAAEDHALVAPKSDEGGPRSTPHVQF